jgi:hypothetical protein
VGSWLLALLLYCLKGSVVDPDIDKNERIRGEYSGERNEDGKEVRMGRR